MIKCLFYQTFFLIIITCFSINRHTSSNIWSTMGAPQHFRSDHFIYYLTLYLFHCHSPYCSIYTRYLSDSGGPPAMRAGGGPPTLRGGSPTVRAGRYMGHTNHDGWSSIYPCLCIFLPVGPTNNNNNYKRTFD